MPGLIKASISRLNKLKLADKPGSVVDSHSSRRTVTSTLKQPTRERREPRQCSPIWSCSGWRLPRFTSTAHKARLTRLCGPIPRLGSPHSWSMVTCCVRPLAVILLCGARTFLPSHDASGDCLASFGRYFSTAGRRSLGLDAGWRPNRSAGSLFVHGIPQRIIGAMPAGIERSHALLPAQVARAAIIEMASVGHGCAKILHASCACWRGCWSVCW